jgi:AcrR family transcriptional regulator
VSLRDDQRDLTRQRIVRAVLDLVGEGAFDELSVPQVARRSGVSLATIYRHFPTRDDLVAAAAEEPVRVAFDSAARDAVEGDDPLFAFHRALWHELAKNLPLVRRQVASQAGRDLREVRGRRARTRVAAYLEGRGATPGTAAFERLVTLVHTLIGSLAFVELHDRQGLDVDDAVDTAQWAIRAVLAADLQELP